MAGKHRMKAVPGTRRRMTELLLAENVPSLGNQGDIVRVRAGYARNYLIPHGLATIATENNKRLVERHREKQVAARAEQLKTFKAVADAISNYPVTIEANANKEGHLYGSIVASDISQHLKNANYPIEPNHIKLEGPLKETGMYTVKVQLDETVEGEVKVWVVPKASVADAT